MQELLKESSAREALEEQIKDLNAEIQRLSAQNKSRILKQPETDTDTLQASHAAEVETLNAQQLKNLEELRSEHELLHQRLEKALGAEGTLEEEKKALSQAIDVLRSELQQAQHRLEKQDVGHQSEGMHLANTIDDLQNEIRAAREDLAEAARREEKASKETSSIVEELRTQMDALCRDHSDQLRVKQEAKETALRELQSSQAELQSLKQLRDDELKRQETTTNESQLLVESLKQELVDLRRSKDDELRLKIGEIEQTSQVIEDLQLQIQRLKHQETDAGRVLETLQTEFKDMQQQHSDSMRAKENEVESLSIVMEGLKDQVLVMQQRETSTKQQEDEKQCMLEEIGSLRSAVLRAENGEAEQRHDKVTEVERLNKVIVALQEEIRTHSTQYTDTTRAAEANVERLNEVISTLQADLQSQHQQQCAVVEANNMQFKGLDEVIARLQTEIATLECEKGDAARRQGLKTQDMTEAIEKSEEHIKQLVESRDVGFEQRDARIQELSERCSELQLTFDQVALEKERLVDELRAAQHEVSGLQKALETLSEDAQEKESQYRAALNKLKSELDYVGNAHNSELQTLKTAHKTGLEDLQAELERKNQEMLGNLHTGNKMLLEEKASIETAQAAFIETLRKDLEAEHQNQILTLQREHAAVVEIMTGNFQEAHEQCDRLRSLDTLLKKGDEDRSMLESSLAELESRCKELQGMVDVASAGEDEAKALKSKVADLQSELSQSVAELAEMRGKHGDAAETPLSRGGTTSNNSATQLAISVESDGPHEDNSNFSREDTTTAASAQAALEGEWATGISLEGTVRLPFYLCFLLTLFVTTSGLGFEWPRHHVASANKS